MKKFDPEIFMVAVRQETGEYFHSGLTWTTARRLLALEGEEFLRQAYPAMLGRQIDKPGLEAYRKRAAKLTGRITILGALWLSPERVYLAPWKRMLLKVCASILRKS